MRADLIQQRVPHADPVFLSIMEHMPDPPPDIYEEVMEALPHLYNVFSHERESSNTHDAKAFKAALREQLELLTRLHQTEKNS